MLYLNPLPPAFVYPSYPPASQITSPSSPNAGQARIIQAAPLVGDAFQTISAKPVEPAALFNPTRFSPLDIKVQTAGIVLSQLRQMPFKPMLDIKDQTALLQLKALLGLHTSLPTPYQDAKHPVAQPQDIFSAGLYNTLATTDPQKRQELLSQLTNTLQASLAATTYNPIRKQIGNQMLTIHNRPLASDLKASYTAPELDRLFKKLENMGVFKLVSHPNIGLPYTTVATHNQAMNFLWTTDSMKIGGFMQRYLEPENFKKNLVANAAVMNTERVQSAVRNVTQNPDWYRRHPDPMHGIPHIFAPDSIKPDPMTGAPDVGQIRFDPNWFNQKRLESQALLLRALTRNFTEGLVPDAKGQVKPWGFNADFLKQPAQFQLVINAIGNLAAYLSKVNLDPTTGRYDMKAPSASSWEEQALSGGCTSDTGDTVLAFESLSDLLYNPAYDQNPGIQTVRQALKQHPHAADIPTPPQMAELIKAGRQVIRERVIDPLMQGRIPRQSEARDADTSLNFLAASDYRFDPTDIHNDARIRLALLKAMESRLLKENGMLRYGENISPSGNRLFDSYLQLDDHFPQAIRKPLHTLKRQKWSLQPYAPAGPTHDATDEQGMLARQSGSAKQYSAQWGLGVSAALQSLASMKGDLVNYWLIRNHPPTPQEKTLLDQINTELNRYINLNLALIAGHDEADRPPISSTGLPLPKAPENLVMEAYEFVQDLNGKPVMLPGAHPLTWGEAQLFDGLSKAVTAAQDEEKLKARYP